MEALLGEMQVDGGLFQIAMTQQGLNNAQIGTRFEQMGGEAMAQRVGMEAFVEACPLRGFPTSMPDCFCVQTFNRAIGFVERIPAMLLG